MLPVPPMTARKASNRKKASSGEPDRAQSFPTRFRSKSISKPAESSLWLHLGRRLGLRKTQVRHESILRTSEAQVDGKSSSAAGDQKERASSGDEGDTENWRTKGLGATERPWDLSSYPTLNIEYPVIDSSTKRIRRYSLPASAYQRTDTKPTGLRNSNRPHSGTFAARSTSLTTHTTSRAFDRTQLLIPDYVTDDPFLSSPSLYSAARLTSFSTPNLLPHLYSTYTELRPLPIQPFPPQPEPAAWLSNNSYPREKEVVQTPSSLITSAVNTSITVGSQTHWVHEPLTVPKDEAEDSLMMKSSLADYSDLSNSALTFDDIDASPTISRSNTFGNNDYQRKSQHHESSGLATANSTPCSHQGRDPVRQFASNQRSFAATRIISSGSHSGASASSSSNMSYETAQVGPSSDASTADMINMASSRPTHQDASGDHEASSRLRDDSLYETPRPGPSRRGLLRTMSLRAPPPPPRLVRSLTVPADVVHPHDLSPTQNTDHREVEARTPQAPKAKRSDSLKSVLRRFSSRRRKDSNNVQEDRKISTSSQGTPKSSTDAIDTPNRFKPVLSPSNRPVSFTAKLKNRKSDPHDSVSSRRIRTESSPSLPLTTSPPRPILPRSSSMNQPRQHKSHGSGISILKAIPKRATSLNRQRTVSWAPSPTLNSFQQPTRLASTPGISSMVPTIDTILETPSTLALSPDAEKWDIPEEFRIRPKTVEDKRRYRRSLVEIKDDRLFQQIFEDMAKFDSLPRNSLNMDDALGIPLRDGILSPDLPANGATEIISFEKHLSHAESGGGQTADNDSEVLLMRSKSLPDRDYSHKRESIGAWFVTREIVQGEKRYGRLLSRGIMLLESLKESTMELQPLEPNIPDIRADELLQDFMNDTEFGAEPSPVDILASRLPHLLGVSLALSSKFEHDPSPVGIAESFLQIENALISAIGSWAGEIGSLVAMGTGAMLDIAATPLNLSRSASIADMSMEDDSSLEKLGFTDIIIMPIQRGLRYHLLFKDLLNRSEPDSVATSIIESALQSAHRLASACNDAQVHDIYTFRRKDEQIAHIDAPIMSATYQHDLKKEERARRRKSSGKSAKSPVENHQNRPFFERKPSGGNIPRSAGYRDLSATWMDEPFSPNVTKRRKGKGKARDQGKEQAGKNLSVAAPHSPPLDVLRGGELESSEFCAASGRSKDRSTWSFF